MVNGTEDRSLIQVSAIFNTDSNKVLTLRRKQLFLTGTFQRGLVQSRCNAAGCGAGHELPVQPRG